MKPNLILIIGSTITIILVLLWYCDFIGEPIAALGGAVLTLISYFVANEKDKQGNSVTKTSPRINQKHTGTGDNVGGDKIVENHNH